MIAARLDLGLAPLDALHPATGAWMRRIESLPGYPRAVPPHWH